MENESIICPNCLEPNDPEQQFCSNCGAPLYPEEQSAPTEEVTVAEEAPAPEEKKEEKKGFSQFLPYLGCYLIVDAIFNIVEALKNAEGQELKLSLLSSLIYIVAGVLMSRDLLKKGYKKLKAKITGVPYEEESKDKAETAETPADEEPEQE